MAAKMLALARARRAGLRAGVTLGSRVRFGSGVRLRVAAGGHIAILSDVEIGANTAIVALDGATVTLGRNVFISNDCLVAAAQSITIGAESMLAENVMIRDHDHDPDRPPRLGARIVQAVSVGERCWVGSKASIVRGGSIGHDSVVGAHALVTKSFSSRVLVGGVPARHIRDLDRP